jgi:hypothetical protein
MSPRPLGDSVCLIALRNIPSNAGFNIGIVGRECHAQDPWATPILASGVGRG